MPFDYQSVLDSLERAADIAWLEERDREDRDEVAAGPEDRRVEPLQTAKPLVIDLFCGLGGWAEGFLAEGYDVVGFDVERHRYPSRAIDAVSIKAAGIDFGRGDSFNTTTERLREAPLTGGWDQYPGQLVLQDVLTLHGSQFRDAAVIVASPPCQEYSYMAMPWSRAKQIAAGLRGLGEFPDGYRGSRTVEQLNALFGACFRIQREASEAAGHHIPLIVENVKGAQPWVGRAAWSFGSYYLWGDVPALMPPVFRSVLKLPAGNSEGSGSKIWSERPIARLCDALKVPGFNFQQHEKTGQPGGSFQSAAVKNNGGSWFNVAHNTKSGVGRNPVNEAVKQHGSGPVRFDTGIASLPSSSHRRKAASAQIAKIPFALANWIARVFDPRVDGKMERSG